MSAHRVVLFVPQHQDGGTGEFFRQRAVAEALHARDRSVRIVFLMPRDCPLRALLPFEHIDSDLPDARRAEFHAREIARLKPAIAVFDKTCRGELLRLCRRLRVAAICVSAEPGTLAKALRADWLWLLPEHWHLRYLLDAPAFSRGQRLRAAIGRTRQVVIDVCHVEPSDRDEHVATVDPYVLLVPGGGGYRAGGRSVAAIFAAAAGLLAAAGAGRVLIVGAADVRSDPGVEALQLLPQAPLLRLMQRALLVVTGGGQTLHQAMSLGVPTVTAPLGGADQGPRIRRYAARGWTVEAALDEPAIAAAALALLQDEPARRRMRERIAAIGLRNGLPTLVDALLARLG